MLKNLGVRAKLLAAFGTLLLLVVLLGAVSLNRMGRISDQWTELSGVVLKKQDALNEGWHGLAEGIQAFKDYVLRGGDYDQRFEADMRRIEAALATYVTLGFISPDETAQLNAAREGIRAYRAAITQLREMRSRDASIAELDRAVAGADRPLKQSLDALRTISERRVEALGADVKRSFELTRAGVFWIGAVIVAAGLLFAAVMTRSITRPLFRAAEVARAVAAGDLTTEVRVDGGGELGRLMGALKDMNGGLSSLVLQVRASTDSIATAAQQIASGTLDLSQRTEEQATSLEETAASIEELTGTVQQNSANARAANQLAVSASEVAQRGGDGVEQIVRTMAGIDRASRKVAEITSVIDSIAFQTNILALNAAVEAARAGEQGRGFAVVAAEVRNLAQRSAAAAKEIKTVIDESLAQVQAGSQLVAGTGRTMREVVDGVKQVSDLMGEIAAAGDEQARGIEQVNEAVSQMDRVTQQNAALVEEASAAAQALREQADVLVGAVGAFKTDAHQQAGFAIAQAQASSRTAVPVPSRSTELVAR